MGFKMTSFCHTIPKTCMTNILEIRTIYLSKVTIILKDLIFSLIQLLSFSTTLSSAKYYLQKITKLKNLKYTKMMLMPLNSILTISCSNLINLSNLLLKIYQRKNLKKERGKNQKNKNKNKIMERVTTLK